MSFFYTFPFLNTEEVHRVVDSIFSHLRIIFNLNNLSLDLSILLTGSFLCAITNSLQHLLRQKSNK